MTDQPQKPENLASNAQIALQFLVVGTGCLALLTVVVGTMAGIMLGVINEGVLGTTTSIGVGGGLVGMVGYAYLVIRKGMGHG